MRASTVRRIIGLVAILLYGATSSSQTVATRRLMKEKLTHTQRILESLMTSNLETLEREAGALAKVTEQPGWAVLTTPEYVHYSVAFVNATSKLVAAAHEHNLDAAAEHYTAMTMACYQCHRYIKSARIARLADLAPLQPPKAVPRSKYDAALQPIVKGNPEERGIP